MATTTINLSQEASRVRLPGSGQTPEGGFGNFLSAAMSAIMALAAVLVLLYLIWGAVDWITSGGEKSKIETARNKIQSALLGLIILAATTALFMLIQQFLGICVLRFSGQC